MQTDKTNQAHLKNAVIAHIKKDNVEFVNTIKEMLNEKIFKLVEDKKIDSMRK